MALLKAINATNGYDIAVATPNFKSREDAEKYAESWIPKIQAANPRKKVKAWISKTI